MEDLKIEAGKVINTNLGLALVIRQDEDMPHLWHLLIGKDKSLVYDTEKSRARSRMGAIMEFHDQMIDQDKLGEEAKNLENKLSKINKLLDDKIKVSDPQDS